MTGFLLACVATVVGLGLGVIGGLYAGMTLVTGAPGHVQLSALRLVQLLALPSVGPVALAGAVVCFVGVRRSRGPGRPRGHPLAMTGVVMSGVWLVILIVGLPLLLVDPCFDLYCD